MSTTTENLGLHKPELTDAADITKTNDNWDKVDTLLSNVDKTAIAESTNGVTYGATIQCLTELYAGLNVTIIPNMTSTSTSVTLNIDDGKGNVIGGGKIYHSTLYNGTNLTPSIAGWMIKNKPLLLVYDGTNWTTVGTRTNANEMYGVVPVAKGGTGATSAQEARNLLGVTDSVMHLQDQIDSINKNKIDAIQCRDIADERTEYAIKDIWGIPSQPTNNRLTEPGYYYIYVWNKTLNLNYSAGVVYWSGYRTTTVDCGGYSLSILKSDGNNTIGTIYMTLDDEWIPLVRKLG